MSYIERIRKNITDALAIRKNAKSNNVDYTTAKIMYHKGANDIDLEDAKKIKTALKNLNISIDMLDTFDSLYEDFLIFEPDKDTLYLSIHNKIKRNHIEELADYFWADYNYGKAIANIMRKGIPLEGAILLFEIKLKYEMKKNNLSEIAALAKILYYDSNEGAKIFEKSYLNGRATYYDPFHTLKNELKNSDEYKKKKINGITILSKTEEGLKKLEALITEAFKKGNEELGSLFPKVAGINNLLVSDISFTADSLQSSYYSPNMKYIYMDKSCLNKLNYGVTVFYHEITHFLDNIKTANLTFNPLSYYSLNNPVVSSLLEKIGKSVNPLKKGLSLGYLNMIKAKKYANDPELNLKWRQEITEKYPNLSEEDYNILMQQKVIAERKKFKLLWGNLTDIYDSLTGGKLFNFGVPGHGKRYYKNKEHIPKEFIANIGAIYNSNATDILRFEFGDELAEQLTNMYHEFINAYNPDQKTR